MATSSAAETMQFLKPAQEQVEAALALQKELLEAYEQASRDWIARVQSELALWSDLGKKLVSTRSVPEAIEAYGECLSAQMKMTAEDGQHLFNDWQQVTQKVTKSLGNGNGWAGRAKAV
jgi:hypothetical protein